MMLSLDLEESLSCAATFSNKAPILHFYQYLIGSTEAVYLGRRDGI